jgi:hypothetical protein
LHQRGNVVEDMPHETPFHCWAYLPRKLRPNFEDYVPSIVRRQETQHLG